MNIDPRIDHPAFLFRTFLSISFLPEILRRRGQHPQMELIETHQAQSQALENPKDYEGFDKFEKENKKTHPAKTPPANTKNALTMRWYQNSGDPLSTPGLPVLCLPCNDDDDALMTRNRRTRVGIFNFMDQGGMGCGKISCCDNSIYMYPRRSFPRYTKRNLNILFLLQGQGLRWLHSQYLNRYSPWHNVYPSEFAPTYHKNMRSFKFGVSYTIQAILHCFLFDDLWLLPHNSSSGMDL